MKKFIVFAVLMGLLVPAGAFAAADFSLGGYVKMEVIWDSTQVNKNLLQVIPRNNNLDWHHGRLKFTAENTRMNFTIKGPKVFGATTTGFIEWDFDNHANDYVFANALGGNTSGGWASPHKARLGIRHAMFRLNWPETELLMGQYWSILTEEVPETANFGAVTTAGQPFLREPQIRLTQTFGVGGGKLMASIAVAEPTNGLWGISMNGTQMATNPYGAESTEVPKVEGRVKYDIDLWGKAAFWGVPRPFSVRLGGAWWRERFRQVNANPVNLFAFGQSNFITTAQAFGANVQTRQQYLEHWLAEASLFVPLLPTHTKNLAGTASLLTQWWVGQGLDGYFEDTPQSGSYLRADRRFGQMLSADRELMRRYGGFVQLQYYFTNQWFADLVWGVNRAYGVSRASWIGDTNANDPFSSNQQYYATLWYRPIQALKFGLEYTYVRTQYFQNRDTVAAGVAPLGNKVSNLGENHRVMFCGFFFF